MKQVVRGFILHPETKKILLVKHVGNSIWTLPGGHIEAGESPQKALKREIKEEFQTKIKIIGPKSSLNFENIKTLVNPLSIYQIEFVSKKYGVTKKLEYIFVGIIKEETLEKFNVDKKEIGEYVWLSEEEILSIKEEEIYGQIPALVKQIPNYLA